MRQGGGLMNCGEKKKAWNISRKYCDSLWVNKHQL